MIDHGSELVVAQTTETRLVQLDAAHPIADIPVRPDRLGTFASLHDGTDQNSNYHLVVGLMSSLAILGIPVEVTIQQELLTVLAGGAAAVEIDVTCFDDWIGELAVMAAADADRTRLDDSRSDLDQLLAGEQLLKCMCVTHASYLDSPCFNSPMITADSDEQS